MTTLIFIEIVLEIFLMLVLKRLFLFFTIY